MHRFQRALSQRPASRAAVLFDAFGCNRLHCHTAISMRQPCGTHVCHAYFDVLGCDTKSRLSAPCDQYVNGAGARMHTSRRQYLLQVVDPTLSRPRHPRLP